MMETFFDAKICTHGCVTEYYIRWVQGKKSRIITVEGRPYAVYDMEEVIDHLHHHTAACWSHGSNPEPRLECRVECPLCKEFINA